MLEGVSAGVGFAGFCLWAGGVSCVFAVGAAFVGGGLGFSAFGAHGWFVSKNVAGDRWGVGLGRALWNVKRRGKGRPTRLGYREAGGGGPGRVSESSRHVETTCADSGGPDEPEPARLQLESAAAEAMGHLGPDRVISAIPSDGEFELKVCNSIDDIHVASMGE